MKPHLCPVCNGTGKYKDKDCHGCLGKGWIPLPEEKEVDIPKIVPYPCVPFWHPPWYPLKIWEGTDFDDDFIIIY